MTWGDETGGADSSQVQRDLFAVKQVAASFYAFAAVRPFSAPNPKVTRSNVPLKSGDSGDSGAACFSVLFSIFFTGC